MAKKKCPYVKPVRIGQIDIYAGLIALKTPTAAQSNAARRHLADIYLSFQAIESRRAIKGRLADLRAPS